MKEERDPKKSTFYLRKGLHRALKIRAATDGREMRDLVEEALEAFLAPRTPAEARSQSAHEDTAEKPIVAGRPGSVEGSGHPAGSRDRRKDWPDRTKER